MPIRWKSSDLSFGMPVYLKGDIGQFMHQLIGIKLVPAGERKTGDFDTVQVKFIVSHLGEETEVYDFECTLEPGDKQIDIDDD